MSFNYTKAHEILDTVTPMGVWSAWTLLFLMFVTTFVAVFVNDIPLLVVVVLMWIPATLVLSGWLILSSDYKVSAGMVVYQTFVVLGVIIMTTSIIPVIGTKVDTGGGSYGVGFYGVFYRVYLVLALFLWLLTLVYILVNTFEKFGKAIK